MTTDTQTETHNELHLFAGAGGGILGGMLLGHTCVCAVEIEPYARQVLLQRQRDGILPRFPIWDDIRTFDGKPWRGLVTTVCGGFPCQDISAAGKGAGIDGERSGLWAEMARVVREVGPRFVFVENSPLLTSRGLGRVLGDLAAMGYDARWGVLGADDAGAPHRRKRIWILANAPELLSNGCNNHAGISERAGPVSESGDGGWKENVADAGHLCWRNLAEPNETQPTALTRCGEVGFSDSEGLEGRNSHGELSARVQPITTKSGWWASEPSLGRVANGVANRVDRLKAIGNGQVPAVAALAWRILSGDTHRKNTAFVPDQS